MKKTLLSACAALSLVALAGCDTPAENANEAGAEAMDAQADATRENADATADAMEDKAETAHDGWVKRRVDKFLSDHDTGTGRGVHLGPLAPRLTILSSGSGPAPILHFWAPDLGGSPIDIHASAAYSLYKYQYYDLRVGLLPQDGTRIPRLERGTNAWFPLADLEKMANGTGAAAYLSARQNLREHGPLGALQQVSQTPRVQPAGQETLASPVGGKSIS